MASLLYVTGNEVKFRQASVICKSKGIELEQAAVHVDEIQSETGEPVARDKAEKIFAQVKRPLVVSDDSWMIPGLKGFPGPYMKSINDWFTPEDWLRLTRDLSDRTIILRQIVVYQDAEQQRTFTVDVHGILLKEVRGTSSYAHTTLTSFDDGKYTIAEQHQSGDAATKDHHNAWHEFAEWYKKERT